MARRAEKTRSIALHETFRLNYRPHQGDDMRVWRDSWFFDQFEILKPGEFAALKVICERFSIPLVEAED